MLTFDPHALSSLSCTRFPVAYFQLAHDGHYATHCLPSHQGQVNIRDSLWGELLRPPTPGATRSPSHAILGENLFAHSLFFLSSALPAIPHSFIFTLIRSVYPVVPRRFFLSFPDSCRFPCLVLFQCPGPFVLLFGCPALCFHLCSVGRRTSVQRRQSPSVGVSRQHPQCHKACPWRQRSAADAGIPRSNGRKHQTSLDY